MNKMLFANNSILIYGPQYSGKRILALELVKKRLSPNNIPNNPDFILLDNDVSIENIRKCLYKLSLKSFYNSYKISLFCNIDLYNVNCLNILLKTLEEPFEKTCIILTTNNLNSIPITIKSRCYMIKMPLESKEKFFTLIEKEINEYIASNNVIIDTNIAMEILYILSHGNICRSKFLLQHDILNMFIKLYYAIINSDITIADYLINSPIFDLSILQELIEICYFILNKNLSSIKEIITFIQQAKTYNLDIKNIIINIINYQ